MKRTRLKAANRPRKAREFVRCYLNPERVAFVKALPCIVTGCTRGPCENAHIPDKSAGAGRKADYTATVSLCPDHHRMHHDRGWKALFPMLSPSALTNALQLAARLTEAAWQHREDF